MLARERKNLTTRVIGEITPFFPIIKGDQTSLATFHEKVINPSVDLAVAIQTSPTPYIFGPRMTKTKINKHYKLSRPDLVQRKVIDAKTGKTLKADSPIVEKEDGTIGEQVALLTPALFRCLPGEHPVRLTQEVILAELYHPLRRRRANTTRTIRHQRSDSEDLLA